MVKTTRNSRRNKKRKLRKRQIGGLYFSNTKKIRSHIWQRMKQEAKKKRFIQEAKNRFNLK